MPKKTKGRAKQKAKANEARQQGGKARKFADNFAAKSVLARDASDDEGKPHHTFRHINIHSHYKFHLLTLSQLQLAT